MCVTGRHTTVGSMMFQMTEMYFKACSDIQNVSQLMYQCFTHYLCTSIHLLLGPGSVNASNNWWGSADVTSAYSRIYDQRRESDVLILDIIPILTDPAIDCSGVANCSGRGECVSPNRCRCNAGKFYHCFYVTDFFFLRDYFPPAS